MLVMIINHLVEQEIDVDLAANRWPSGFDDRGQRLAKNTASCSRTGRTVISLPANHREDAFTPQLNLPDVAHGQVSRSSRCY